MGVEKKSRSGDQLLKQALRDVEKASLKVAGATIEVKVTLSFGETAKTAGNELDDWMARHADTTKEP
jgi:hypothetical protein